MRGLSDAEPMTWQNEPHTPWLRAEADPHTIGVKRSARGITSAMGIGIAFDVDCGRCSSAGKSDEGRRGIEKIGGSDKRDLAKTARF
jgi:hypothetical protein